MKLWRGLVGTFLALLVVLLLFLSSQRAVLGVSHWLFERFTDYRIELRYPELNLLAGELSLEELHLVPKSGGVPVLSLYQLSAGTRLGDLLAADLIHSWLRATHLVLYVVADGDDEADDENLEPIEALELLAWLPQELRLSRAHLVVAAPTVQVVELTDIVGGRAANGTRYDVSTVARYKGDQLDVSLGLQALLEGETFSGVEMQANILAPASASELDLHGLLQGSANEFQYDMQIKGRSDDIETFLKGLGPTSELEGGLSLSARIHGDGNGFRLSDVNATLDNMPAYRFQASGTLLYSAGGDTKIALLANGELASLKIFLRRLDMDLGEFGRAGADLTISGSLQQPVVDNFELRTGNVSGLEIVLTGQLDTPLQPGRAGIDGNQIRVDASAPSGVALEPWLGRLPPGLGAWQATGRFVEYGERLSLEDLVVAVGKPGSLQLRAEGSVDDLAGVVEHQLAGVKGVTLNLSFTTPDAAQLAQLLDIDELKHHRIDASLKLSGDGNLLQGHGGQLSARSSDLRLNASAVTLAMAPTSDEILLALEAPFEGVLSDTGALSQYSNSEIPVLGPMTFRGRLLKKEGAEFSLTDLSGEVTTDDLSVQVEGDIASLPQLEGVVLDARFEGIDIRESLLLFADDLQYTGSLGKLGGSFRLLDRQGRWDIDSMVLRGRGDSGALELSAQGVVKDLSGALSADARASFHLRDPLLLEALTGLRISPVQGSMEITSERDSTHLRLLTRVGESNVRGDAQLHWRDENIDGLALALSMPRLHLQDFGLQSTDAAGDDYRPAARIEEGGMTASWATLTAALPSYPIDIAVSIDNVIGDETNIQNLDVHFTGVQQRYTLRRFNAEYGEASAEFSGVVDFSSQTPVLSLGGQALALPMSALSEDLAIDTDFNGIISVKGGVTAHGDTTDAQLSSLSGNMALVVEDMVVEGAAYDVLASDLLGWLYSGAALESSTDIDCAMASFNIEKGVAQTKNLYVETDRMLATGNMILDLVKRNLDLTLTPLSKSRALQLPSTVRLKGPLNDLEPQISTVSAAIDTYTAWLTLLPELALEILGVKGSATDKLRPCQT